MYNVRVVFGSTGSLESAELGATSPGVGTAALWPVEPVAAQAPIPSSTKLNIISDIQLFCVIMALSPKKI
jgi:hypothetical protein